jgi:hypothetical protein
MPGACNPVNSPLSVGPAQARKTTSRIGGVNKDNVRCESVRVARRSRFFLENKVSLPESRDMDAISAAFRGLPEESTASWGGLARGSKAGSSCDVPRLAGSCCCRASCSGTHKRSESLCMIAGSSSISSILSCPSISFCKWSRTNGIESKVDETFNDSRGSFRKTNVKPFCLEKTKTMKPDSFMSERVIWRGIVRPVLGMR